MYDTSNHKNIYSQPSIFVAESTIKAPGANVILSSKIHSTGIMILSFSINQIWLFFLINRGKYCTGQNELRVSIF